MSTIKEQRGQGLLPAGTGGTDYCVCHTKGCKMYGKPIKHPRSIPCNKMKCVICKKPLTGYKTKGSLYKEDVNIEGKDLVDNYLDFINEAYVQEVGVAGNVIGMVLFGPLLWAAWRGIIAAFSKANRQCGALKISNQRDACLAKVRIKFSQDKINFAKKSMKNCEKTRNPGKCKAKLIKAINEEEKKIEEQQNKLRKLSYYK